MKKLNLYWNKFIRDKKNKTKLIKTTTIDDKLEIEPKSYHVGEIIKLKTKLFWSNTRNKNFIQSIFKEVEFKIIKIYKTYVLAKIHSHKDIQIKLTNDAEVPSTYLYHVQNSLRNKQFIFYKKSLE